MNDDEAMEAAKHPQQPFDDIDFESGFRAGLAHARKGALTGRLVWAGSLTVNGEDVIGVAIEVPQADLIKYGAPLLQARCNRAADSTGGIDYDHTN